MFCPEIDVKTLKSELSQWQILDVRTDEEFKVGHVTPSIHIPLHELIARIKELDKNERYAVMCRSGARSMQATQIMLESGFGEVVNISGGMKAWAAQVDPSIKVG